MGRNTLEYVSDSCKLAFSMICIPLCVHMSASEYVFQVHTAESCPKTRNKMNERSLALNCTESNGYTCLPNENISVLLEFCYKRARIPVTKGFCLFLRYSDVDAYDCQRFFSGCPEADYFTDEIYKYPNCVSIGNGCFLADPSCDSAVTIATTFSKELDKTADISDRTFGIVTILGLVILICIAIGIFSILIRKTKSSKQQSKMFVRSTGTCHDTETSYALQSLIPETEWVNGSSCPVEGTTKDKERIDVEDEVELGNVPTKDHERIALENADKVRTDITPRRRQGFDVP